MPGRSIAGQDTLIQRETVPGTPVTNAMRRYLALRMTPGWDGTADAYYGGTGKVPTSVLLTDETGTWDVTGAQDFNCLGAVASSRIAMPATDQPDSGGAPTAYRHVFEINPDAADTVATYTAQYGDTTQSLQAVYGVFNTLGLTVERGNLGFDTSFVSRPPTTGATLAATNEVQTVTITGTPTGGTFTLSFLGFTTTAIAYNAIASVVQTALQALSSIGAGNATVGGGPGPGTPYTVTFTGRLARRDVPMMTAAGSFTGGASPAIAVTQTTAGNPSDIAAKPIPPKNYNIYADDSWATLGTTQLVDCYTANVTLGDKFQPDAPINSSIVGLESWLEQLEQEHSVALRLGLATTAIGFMNTFQAGAMKFIRWSVTGPLIAAATSYSMIFDCAIYLTGRGGVGPAPNSPAVTVGDLTGVMAKDATTGKVVRLTLVNEVPSY